MSASSQWAELELRHLLALQAIAEHGSFHKAAEHLGYTQSGISQQIAALERIIGARVLQRPGGSRPVRLTEAGDVVLRHARAIFGQITAAQADIARLGEASAGVLRVGAFQSVSAKILPHLLRRLARQRPRPRIELTQTTSDPELFALLKAGDLDITFAMLPVPEGPFAAVELFSDPFVVLAPADSGLARRGGRLSARELAELPLVAAQCCRSTSHLEAQLRERGLEPMVVHRSDDNGTVLGLVASGAGLALVPRMVAEWATGDVAILEFDEWLPPRRVGLSWRSDRHLSPLREAFVAAVRETCGGLSLRSSR
jgi:DNA-binding transcriptional LysR family regulator